MSRYPVFYGSPHKWSLTAELHKYDAYHLEIDDMVKVRSNFRVMWLRVEQPYVGFTICYMDHDSCLSCGISFSTDIVVQYCQIIDIWKKNDNVPLSFARKLASDPTLKYDFPIILPR